MESILAVSPKTPKIVRLDKCSYQSRDEAAAKIFNAVSRRLVYHQGIGNDWRVAKTVPLSTWIVAPPTTRDAELAFWFEGESQDSDFRLIIHGMPSKFEGNEIQAPWHSIYYKNIPVRPRRSPYKCLKQKTQPFLKKWLDAYSQGGHEATGRFMSQIGHPVREAYSNSWNSIE